MRPRRPAGLVLGFRHFVESFLHLIETNKQKPKNEQPKGGRARTENMVATAATNVP